MQHLTFPNNGFKQSNKNSDKGCPRAQINHFQLLHEHVFSQGLYENEVNSSRTSTELSLDITSSLF